MAWEAGMVPSMRSNKRNGLGMSLALMGILFLSASLFFVQFSERAKERTGKAANARDYDKFEQEAVSAESKGVNSSAVQDDGSPEIRSGDKLRDSGSCKWAKYRNFPPKELLRDADRRKIVYVKVPKSGSTTVSCLLEKVAIHRNLPKLVLRNTTFIRDEQVVRSSMDKANMTTVGAFLNHIYYNETMVNLFLSQKVRHADGSTFIQGPFRIASVRDPLDRLMSSYFYALDSKSHGEFVCSGLAGDYKEWVDTCEALVGETDYMAPKDWDAERREDVELVSNHYDHIMVTDQMVRSILTLIPKLGLTLEDLLVVSQKHGSRLELEKRLTQWEMDDLTSRMKNRAASRRKELMDSHMYRTALKRLDHDFNNLPVIVQNAQADIEDMTEDAAKYCQGPDHAEERPLFDNCISNFVRQHVRC